jgi:5,10-methylenetetrahydromethanopterin reductase
VRTSLRVNNDLSASEVVALARAAEAAGFDQLWVSHDLFLRSAPVLLAAVAGATARLELGIGIANPYTVHPAEIAMTAATLNELSGGRFLLGLSAGAPDFLSWAGISQERPRTRTAEALRAIRTLLDGGRPVEHPGTGTGWTPQAHLRMPTTATPIYVGAMSPRMLELAGAEADGALPLLFPPEHLTVATEHVRAGARAAGRDPATIDIAACFWCSVDDDGDAARRALAEKLAYYGPSFSPYLLERAGIAPEELEPIRTSMAAGDVDGAVAAVDARLLSLGVAGDAASLVERCAGLIDMGATHLSFGPPLGPDPVDAVGLLGERVLPALVTRPATRRPVATQDPRHKSPDTRPDTGANT